jgi:hypothetical protein
MDVLLMIGAARRTDYRSELLRWAAAAILMDVSRSRRRSRFLRR